MSWSRKPRAGLAASALTGDGTLLRVTLSTPPSEQVATLARLSCLSKAVHAAVLPVWQELCFSRWPSSGSLAGVDEPRAWRALALARSAAQVPSLTKQRGRHTAVPPWQDDDLAPFVARRQPLLLLDVSVDDLVIFSGRLGAGENDRLMQFTETAYEGAGVVADDDDAAEEYTEAHQHLHLAPGAHALTTFPERLLLLHAQGKNQLHEGDCVTDFDLDAWDGDADDAADAASSAHAITAELCVILVSGKVAVLPLGAATRDRDVHDHFRGDDDIFASGELWQPQPSGMLRWARTFEAGALSHHSAIPSFDVILNVYCLSESKEPQRIKEGEDGDAQAAPAAEPGPLEGAPSSSAESESDVSAGDEAVREVAADRQERQQRLREALRAHDAERAVLARQLADCLDGQPARAGSKIRDSDLDDIAVAEAVPSPRVSDSSQQTMTTASDSAADSRIKPTSQMRLALASLSIGWIPAGDVGAALLRSRREAWAAEHEVPVAEIDDEREISEAEELAVQEAEAAYFWQQLDARMPWL